MLLASAEFVLFSILPSPHCMLRTYSACYQIPCTAGLASSVRLGLVVRGFLPAPCLVLNELTAVLCLVLPRSGEIQCPALAAVSPYMLAYASVYML